MTAIATPSSAASDTNGTDDTGARLRGLYAHDGGVGQVFSAKIADYVASRPDYPAALFDALATDAGLVPGAVVADLGAGTGLLTAGLLARGAQVTAIEPSAEMRAAADAWLGAKPGYRSQPGSAEATGLPDASVDLITAAQAFHWFDIAPAQREALRVLRPAGQVALIWNDRREGDPLHVAMDELFAEFGGERRRAMIAHETGRGDVPAFFGFAPRRFAFDHAHRLDRAGLLALAFSRSYMPARASDAGRAAAQALQTLFERFADADGSVTVRYTTVLMLGRPRA
jgi:SAM-dependent methyltransferase